jgi:DASS family divalent anion:Na+ symporter
MTAHATAMYAAFLGVAVAAGAPPVMAALVLAVLSSLNGSLTHYSTGPAVIFFESGYVTQSEWWHVGFVVSVINLLIWGGLAVPYWKVIRIW